MTWDLEEWNAYVARAANGVIVEVLKHLPHGGVFVDVGANTGAVTAAAIAERDARVWAFEPVPELATFCQSRNPTARVMEVALGADWDRATLWCDLDANRGWNTFVAEKLTPGMVPIEVPVMALDSFFDIPPIDVLKIDVEGYEWAVLRGAHQRILADMPVIIIELGWGTGHPQRAEDVYELEWLFDNGYARVPYEADEVTHDYVLVPA